MQYVTNYRRERIIKESSSFIWLSSASVLPPSRNFPQEAVTCRQIRVKTVWNLEKASVEKFRITLTARLALNSQLRQRTSGKRIYACLSLNLTVDKLFVMSRCLQTALRDDICV